jgi:ribosomal protein L17
MDFKEWLDQEEEVTLLTNLCNNRIKCSAIRTTQRIKAMRIQHHKEVFLETATKWDLNSSGLINTQLHMEQLCNKMLEV